MDTPAAENTMQHIARSLTVALGERDHHTRHHSDRVVNLAIEFGRHLGFSQQELTLLSLGAQFHDLGKIGIPDQILRKPAPFEEVEREQMRQHPIIGERIILAIGDEKAPDVARTVRHHHEHFDGSGYPDGLSGQRIPLHARIVSLTDNYDAMAAARPYHQARTHQQVMDILHREVGQKHDPDLLQAFCAAIEKSPLRAPDA